MTGYYATRACEMCPIRTEASDEERLGLVMKNINYEERGVITEDELEGKQIDLDISSGECLSSCWC